MNPATTATDHFVHVNGVRLHYRRAGSPGHRFPAAVMLPGAMGHAREWDVVVGDLAADRVVFALDQRGHGLSDWADDYSLTALATDLIRFLETNELSNVDLIGHSLGAMAAMTCAATRPELVRRLVLIDIAPDSLSTPWAHETLPQTLAGFAAAAYGSESEAVSVWMEGNELAREPLMRHYVHHALRRREDGRLVWRFDAAGLAPFLARIDSEGLWRALDQIAAPTLLIRGEFSDLVSAESAAAVVRRLRDGHLVRIAAGGHDLGVQQPEAVAAAIRTFLG